MARVMLLCAVLAVAGCASTETRVAPAGEAHAAPASKTPANVLDAARDAVPGLVVTGTNSEIENGVLIYDVTGTADGVVYEVEVTADGKVTEIEKGDDDADGDDDGPDDD
jgi:nucleoside-diphosphate-sugar epimerase